MRTLGYLGCASAWFVIAAVAAFGRWGLAVAAMVVTLGCVLAAATAAGVERGDGSA